MVKQRKDALEIYKQQNRTDLAQKEAGGNYVDRKISSQTNE